MTAEIESLGQYLEPKLRIKCCVGSPNVKTEEARDERIALVRCCGDHEYHLLVCPHAMRALTIPFLSCPLPHTYPTTRPPQSQVKSLKTEPPHVLVGTMGRVCDLAEGRDRSGPVIWCVGWLVG